MKVLSEPLDVHGEPLRGTVVTIGVFDGVHIGHLKVIDSLSTIKRTRRLSASVLLTFDCHPLSIVHPEMVPPLLTTLDEKVSILGGKDIDYLLIERFTAGVAGVDYRDFIAERLIGQLGMRHFVVGYDFHMGRGREGSMDHIRREGARMGFGVTIVPPVVLDGRVVSSTKIRRAILERRLDEAERYLGRPYFFDAEVVRGKGLGRTIDFPTANVAVTGRGKLLPPGGVYAVRIEVDASLFDGMMNVGIAPTLHADRGETIEVHVFGFSGEIYGKRLRIHCVEFLREERRFPSPGRLKEQLVQDRENVMRILQKKH